MKTEYVILAKDRLEQLGTDRYEILETFKGKELVGKSYEPPFPYHQNREFENKENAWKIYHAPYVELGDEGTGAVHLAPAYGEEDMELAKEHNIPIIHHVDAEGHFMDFVTDFAGQLVKPKDDDDAGVTHLDADIEIVKKLKTDGKLFLKENITHSYPHCWRCDTPLLNYATTSWFVEATKLRDQLVSENEKVNWVPEHVGKNRFGKWLENVRDWAVSRQRYWGAPLPIWRNPKTKEYKVFGSLKELQEYVPKSGNTYHMMRHGEADHNLSHIMSSTIENPHHLTEKGKQEVVSVLPELKEKGIDLIYVSPMNRTQQTAKLVAEALGLSEEQVITDERLHDNLGGIFELRPVSEWYEYRKNLSTEEKLTDCYEGGESWRDIKRRMTSVLFDIETKYKDKNVLIISHGMPMELMKWNVEGVSHSEMVRRWDNDEHFGTGEVGAVPFVPFPHNDHYELDFHRPYIDEIELYDGDVKLERVPDVFDCWFESGSMPYAETHYPFENLDVADIEKGVRYPADFISEAVDQTRGWFYSLMVLGVALTGKAPYQNVITNGLVLAEDGKKMSKKLQNYPDPVELVERQGADSMRFYLLSSSIIKGEDLNFSEKEVQELQRKNIGRLHNVLAMYEQYAGGEEARDDSDNVLDRWIVARLNELIQESTEGFKNYELDRATRPITDFIDDLSVWYLRRSRDRLKGEDQTDKEKALGTLRHVLQNLALVMAPSMPFYADYLWGRVKAKDDAESVHLAAWPKAEKPDPVVLGEMSIVREFVTIAHEARAKAGIKVRQPLPALRTQIELAPEYAAIVADELNVKTLVFVKDLAERAELDTHITPELKAEGDAREFMRQVQDLRKRTGLSPQDRINLKIQTSDGGEAVLKQFADDIKKTVGANKLEFVDAKGEEITAGEHSFTVELVKH